MSKNIIYVIEGATELFRLILKILFLPDEGKKPSGQRRPDENENNERPF
jgi:hypothetical protein